jgi:2,5-dihydroxypyridine 5,6-dioxygenase
MAIQHKWIENFAHAFQASGVCAGQWVVVAAESESNPDLIALSELALQRIGARVTLVRVPSPAVNGSVPIRSTGASTAFDAYPELMTALGDCSLLVDCSVEGLLHSRARQTFLAAGGRLLMISNEHPEILERCLPDVALRARVDYSLKRLEAASTMQVRSRAGTNLTVDIDGAPCRAGAGFLTGNDKVAYWPAGLCLCFPLTNTVNGTVVIDVGDVNLTFKRYFESQVTLTIENDQVVDIAGEGLDARMLRSYYDAWNDPLATAISHVGWGLNPRATWEALNLYDKSQCNGTELRAVEGSFMISTGANEFAERFTNCHFDIPMRNCSVMIDEDPVLVDGRLQGRYN